MTLTVGFYVGLQLKFHNITGERRPLFHFDRHDKCGRKMFTEAFNYLGAFYPDVHKQLLPQLKVAGSKCTATMAASSLTNVTKLSSLTNSSVFM